MQEDIIKQLNMFASNNTYLVDLQHNILTPINIDNISQCLTYGTYIRLSHNILYIDVVNDVPIQKILPSLSTEHNTIPIMYDKRNNDAYVYLMNTNNKVLTLCFQFCKLSTTKGTAKEQEMGVAICIDMIFQHKCIMPLSDYDIITYQPSSMMNINDATMIANGINMLLCEQSWRHTCATSAMDIVKYIKSDPNIPDINMYDWEIHRNTYEFFKIKSCGALASNVSRDKWNPSDIFLISKTKGLSTINKLSAQTNSDTINELLSYPFKNEIIGISLKGEIALHGSVSLTTIKNYVYQNKTLGIPEVKWFDVKKSSDGYDISIYDKRKLIKSLQYLTKIKSKKLYAYGIENVDFNKRSIQHIIDSGYATPAEFQDKLSSAIEHDISKYVYSMRIDSRNFGKSLPTIIYALQKLAEHNKNFDLALQRLAFIGYMYASSRVVYVTIDSSGNTIVKPISAEYLKEEAGKGVKLIRPDINYRKFRLLSVRVPFDGAAAVVFDIKYDGRPMKLQFRSKGSTGQFILIDQDETDKAKHSILMSKLA